MRLFLTITLTFGSGLTLGCNDDDSRNMEARREFCGKAKPAHHHRWTCLHLPLHERLERARIGTEAEK